MFFAGVRYEPSSWSELQNAIDIGTLESLSVLGRRAEDYEMYKRFKETEILSSWVAIQDYLMCKVFGCQSAVDSAAGNMVYFIVLIQSYNSIVTDTLLDAHDHFCACQCRW